MQLVSVARALNEGAPASPITEGPALAARLSLGLRDIVSEAAGLYGDARAASRSPRLAPLLEDARRLAGFDPRSLALPAARAFWLNAYNALVRHGVIAKRIRRSMRETPLFFARVAWRLGPFVLSLDDIEHGILRENRNHPLYPWRRFGAADPRRQLVLTLDPRIHFALNCGARSCPPVAAYTAERLESQLDAATRSFLSQELEVSEEARTVRVSRILHWYARDFPAGPLAWAITQVTGPSKEALLRALREGYRVRPKPYDWKVA
jgi:hypothetical protein